MACFSQELGGGGLADFNHAVLSPVFLSSFQSLLLYCLSVHCCVWVKSTSHGVLIYLKQCVIKRVYH